MSRGKVIGIVVGGLIILVLLFAYFGTSPKEETQEYSAPVWSETYYNESIEPYGTYVLFELLEEEPGELIEMDDNDLLRDVLPDNPDDTGYVYFMVGSEQYLSEIEAEALVSFIERGNTAFIATEYPHSFIFDKVMWDSEWISKIDSMATVYFADPALANNDYKFIYHQNFEAENRYWDYTSPRQFSASGRVDISFDNDGYIVCAQVPYGAGKLVFHTIPLMFTNYFMLDSTGLEYAEGVLSHLPRGKTIIWDELTKHPHSQYDQTTGNRQDEEPNYHQPTESPLQFILAHPSLKWSYYLLWMTILLYLLFKGKREQRIIPPIEKDENTTMNFINTVGDLYFRQGKHEKLVAHKKKIFLDYIKSHYYLPVHKIDKEFISRLSMKSGINEEELNRIFRMFDQLEGQKVSDEQLIKLHRMIEKFHKNSH